VRNEFWVTKLRHIFPSPDRSFALYQRNGLALQHRNQCGSHLGTSSFRAEGLRNIECLMSFQHAFATQLLCE
jgi:hypothetical protein